MRLRPPQWMKIRSVFISVNMSSIFREAVNEPAIEIAATIAKPACAGWNPVAGGRLCRRAAASSRRKKICKYGLVHSEANRSLQIGQKKATE